MERCTSRTRPSLGPSKRSKGAPVTALGSPFLSHLADFVCKVKAEREWPLSGQICHQHDQRVQISSSQELEQSGIPDRQERDIHVANGREESH